MTRERPSYKDSRVIHFVERTNNVICEELLKRKVVYHEGFYSPFSKTYSLNCAKKQFLTSIDTGESSIMKRTQGKLSKAANNDTTQREKLATQSQFENKSECSIS